MEEFKPSKAGGNPPDKKTVLTSMINKSLEGLLKNPNSGFFGDVSHRERARKELNEYLEKIQADIRDNPKRSKTKAEFWKIIESKKDAFVNGLADAVGKAFQGFEEPKNGDAESKKEENLKKLRKRFIEALTTKCTEDNCDAAPLVESLTGK